MAKQVVKARLRGLPAIKLAKVKAIIGKRKG